MDGMDPSSPVQIKRQDFLNDTILNGTSTYAKAGASVNAFGTALITGISLAALQIGIFLLIREHRPELYLPKTFLVPKREQTEAPKPGLLGLLRPIFRRSDDEFLKKSGPDGFFLCRYLLVLLKILSPMCLATLILTPINSRGGNDKIGLAQGLQVYSIANIRKSKRTYIWAHVVIAIVFIVWTCWVIFDELRTYIRIRQGFLASPQHRLRASASTVLVQSLSKKYMDKAELENLFDIFPGGIRNVWINRDYSSLTTMVKKRDKFAKHLEKAETKLIKKCVAHQSKKGKRKSTVGLGTDGSDKSPDPLGAPWSGLNANDPQQVHHTVADAVEALRRAEKAESKRPNKQGFGSRLGAVAQGVTNIGRGLVKGDTSVVRLGSVRKIGRRPRTARSADNDQVDGSISDADSPQFPDSGEQDHASLKERQASKESPNPAESPSTLYQPFTAESRNESIDREEKAVALAYNPEFENDKNMDAKWREFISEKDRPTLRIKHRLTWPASLQ